MKKNSLKKTCLSTYSWTSANSFKAHLMAHWRPIAESLCCVFGQDTLISQSVSPLRSINGYRRIVQTMFKFQFLLILLFYFFSSLNTLWFRNTAILGSRWVSGEEMLITVLFALRCLVPHKFMHDVQREQFSTSVPRGFTLLYHVVGQVISSCQLCVDQFKAYSHPSPGIWTFKDFFFSVKARSVTVTFYTLTKF